MSQISALNKAKNCDINLRTEEVEKGIEQTSCNGASKTLVGDFWVGDEHRTVRLTGVESVIGIEPTRDRQSGDERIPNCHRHNNINECHDENAGVL